MLLNAIPRTVNYERPNLPNSMHHTPRNQTSLPRVCLCVSFPLKNLPTDSISYKLKHLMWNIMTLNKFPVNSILNLFFFFPFHSRIIQLFGSPYKVTQWEKVEFLLPVTLWASLDEVLLRKKDVTFSFPLYGTKCHPRVEHDLRLIPTCQIWDMQQIVHRFLFFYYSWVCNFKISAYIYISN